EMSLGAPGEDDPCGTERPFEALERAWGEVPLRERVAPAIRHHDRDVPAAPGELPIELLVDAHHGGMAYHEQPPRVVCIWAGAPSLRAPIGRGEDRGQEEGRGAPGVAQFWASHGSLSATGNACPYDGWSGRGRILLPMNETTTDAAAIFAPLWKRKWLILAVGILVAGATYAYYKNKPSVYTASTQLYLGGDAEAQSALAGTSGKSTLSGRALADQVGLITSPVIGEGVRKQLRKEGDLAAARGKAKAASTATSDFITISTEANRPRGAINLANAYARAYINRERSSYVRAVDAAIANTRQQLRRLETSQSAPTPTTTKSPSGAKGNTTAKAPATLSGSATIQAASLASKLNQLESQLSVSGVQQVGTAKASPLPVSPTPKKNAIFGFVLGLVLASIAAYILSRFDRRVRSLDDVEHIFGTQI